MKSSRIIRQSIRRRGTRGRRGSALIPVVILIAALIGATSALLNRTGSYSRGVSSTVEENRADLLAQGALAEAVTALRAGSSGNVGTIDAPARLGDGLFWVTSEDLGDKTFRLVATALLGSGRSAMEMIVSRGGGGEGDLFSATINAKDQLTLASDVMVDSFDSSLGAYESQATNTHVDSGNVYANTDGNVRSNDDIILNARAHVFGDAEPGPTHVVTQGADSYVYGSTTPALEPFDYPDIVVPDYGSTGAYSASGSVSLLAGNHHFDSLTLTKAAQLTIQGPANVVVNGAFLGGKDARLLIDATGGPVTIYCDTYVHEQNFEAQPAVAESPMAVAFMITGSDNIVFPSLSKVRGAYYAENSNIVFSNDNEAWGSFVGNGITMSSTMKFHFDEDLANHWAGGGDPGDVPVESLAWYEVVVEPAGLRRDRSDPFALLGVDRAALQSPANAWIAKE